MLYKNVYLISVFHKHFLGICEGGKVYKLPRSNDTFCFLSVDKGKKTWDEGAAECQKGGYDGHLEFRYEEDTIFMAKLMYCGWGYIRGFQPGMFI